MPLTFIAVPALVVLLAWLLGGVGSRTARLGFGLPWITALLIGWTLMLYRPVAPGRAPSVQ